MKHPLNSDATNKGKEVQEGGSLATNVGKDFKEGGSLATNEGKEVKEGGSLTIHGDFKGAASQENVDYETAIEKTGFGKFNLFLLILAFPATCSISFDSASIPFVLPVATCDLGLTGLDRGLLNGAVYAGMISSSFIWGYLSDKLGRQKLLALGYLLDAFFAIGSSFLQNKWAIFLFKYLSGCAISGPYSMFMTYISEMFGKKYRDPVILSVGVYTSVGGVIHPLMALAVIPKVINWELFGGLIKISSWRLFLILSAAPPLTAGLLALLCVESPKFLLGKGRKDEAINVLRYMYAKNTGKPPESYPVNTLQDETTPTEESSSNCFQQVSSAFKHPHVKNTLLCCGVQFLALNALNTIRLWLPLLFFYIQSAGGEMNTCQALSTDLKLRPTDCSKIIVDEEVYIQLMYINFTTACCMALSSYFVKKIGKKMLIVCCFTIATVLVVSMPWANTSYVVWVACVYSGVIYAASIAIVGLAIELFPTSMRTLAVSLTMTCGRIGVVLGSVIHPFLLAVSCWTPFVTVGALCTISAIVMLIAAPGRTKEKRLKHSIEMVAN